MLKIKKGKNGMKISWIVISLFFATLLLSKESLPNFTQAEKKWIASHQVIKVGSGDDWAPFNYIDQYGNFKGITKDYLDLIEKKSSLKIDLHVDKWAVVLQEFKDKKLDLLPAALYQKEREEFGNFVKPHIHLRDFIYARADDDSINSFDDLNGKTLVRIKGYAVLDPYLQYLKNVKIIEVGSALELVTALHNKKADAFLEGQANINHILKENMIGGIKSIAQNVTYPTTAHMLVRKDEPILYEIINKTMQSITPAEHETIMNRWINIYSLNNNITRFTIQKDKINMSQVMDSAKKIFLWAFFIVLLVIAYMLYTRSNFLNMKFTLFNTAIITFELLIICFLIYEVFLLDRSEHALAKAYSERFKMVKAADKIRQSSDDLTHFARTYVITGDDEFKSRYDATLKIRHGKLPRPYRYDGIYWDLNEVTRDELHPDTKPIALWDIIKALPFSKEELKLLKYSENNSYELVKMETKAFDAVDAKDREKAIELLHSQKYYDAKHKIMLPIDEMLSMLDKRTEAEIAYYEEKVSTQFNALFLGGLIFIIGNLLVYYSLRKKVNQPISYLTDTILYFQENRSDIEKKRFFNDEIGFMIEEFFNMQDIIHKRTAEVLKNQKYLQKAQQMNALASKHANIVYWALNPNTKEMYSDPSFIELLGYDTNEIMDMSDEYQGLKKIKQGMSFWSEVILHPDDKKRALNELDSLINEQTILYKIDYRLIKSDESIMWFTSIGHVLEHNEDGSALIVSGVNVDITEMEEAKLEVERLHKNTQDSIEYASLIQGALIPNSDTMRRHFDDYFVLWHPKDLVGGDIFLLEGLFDDKETLLMVIDCTGHGVPGAFVTMLVKAIERQLVSTIERTDEIVSPARLLSIFNRSIKHLLQQESSESISNAGFDGGIIHYDKKNNKLKFAGANTPLFVMKNGELNVIKGDRHSVGYKSSDSNFVFTDHEIIIDEQTSIYLSTDGYFDQNGGEKGFPFGKKRFKKLIEQYHNESMADQQEYFLDELYEYQGDENRNDDVTLVAFKVHPNH